VQDVKTQDEEKLRKMNKVLVEKYQKNVHTQWKFHYHD
jgi:hypothetical protein